MDHLTEIEYSALQTAYDFFNHQLFKGSLPQVLVVLHRRANSKGYFAADRFSKRRGKALTHELALNPDVFLNQTDEEICSTLVHEMVHCWQRVDGKPGRKGYHNAQWATMMKQVGLQPSHTGEVGRRETGQSMTHYIIPDGPYARAFAVLKKEGKWKLNWQSSPIASRARGQNKIKYTCPTCGLNAWAKPDTQQKRFRLLCGVCEQSPELVVA
jgi:predicted SprT family Zn-dependent metalloprotease